MGRGSKVKTNSFQMYHITYVGMAKWLGVHLNQEFNSWGSEKGHHNLAT